jgi:hypothetical protein
MNNVICQAIRERKVISFTYDDFPRVVEPHCHGVSTAGNSVLRCYQSSGGSSSGKVPGWHMMKTGKIIGLTVSQSVFTGPRDGYKKDDKGMSTIYEQL